MKSKHSLAEQFEIEDKRKKLKDYNVKWDPKKPLLSLFKIILPNIKWKHKQILFINALAFIRWYLGGYKSGKTFTGVCLDIVLSFINRPYPGILVHPTADGVDITILPLIDEICKLNKIEYEVKKLSTKWKVYFKFGLNKKDWGQLILASGDKPKSLKGPKLAWAHIDEPLIMAEEISSVILSRLAELRSVLRLLFYTGTPEPLHMKWGFDIVDKENEDTPERFITTVSAREIKEHLPPGYIEQQEATYTPEMVLTFVDGKYRNLSQGAMYFAFKREKNVFDPLNLSVNIPEDAERELVLSYDFNVKQMSAVLWELAGKYKLQYEEFRIQTRSNTEELTNLAIERLKDSGYLVKSQQDGWYYTKHGKSVLITGDATGKSGSSKSNVSDYEIIQQAFDSKKVMCYIAVDESNPAVRDRVNYMNKQFSLGYCLISEKCKLSIRDRELGVWKLGADGFIVDKSKAEISHLNDAGDYGVYNTRDITDDDDGEESSAGGNCGYTNAGRQR